MTRQIKPHIDTNDDKLIAEFLTVIVKKEPGENYYKLNWELKTKNNGYVNRGIFLSSEEEALLIDENLEIAMDIVAERKNLIFVNN
jgi:hypothetical protein